MTRRSLRAMPFASARPRSLPLGTSLVGFSKQEYCCPTRLRVNR